MRHVFRLLLGVLLLFTGKAHLTGPESFAAQVPPWFPAPDLTIFLSGIVELLLGLSLIFAPRQHRARAGLAVAAFFIIVYPGNISQFVTRTDAFGLDSDLARGVRLLLQPVLIAWALWSTQALKQLRRDKSLSPEGGSA